MSNAARFLVSGKLVVDTVDETVCVDRDLKALGGKPFLVLLALMETPRVLVTKDALFENVWQGQAVSDSVLTTAIKEVRQALGDDARNPIFIETVHRRGYRFLGEVQSAETVATLDDITNPSSQSIPQQVTTVAAPSRPAWRSGNAYALFLLGLVAAIAVLVAAPIDRATFLSGHDEEVSVAVLPFHDVSVAEQRNWLAVGLTEEISASLGRVPEVRVASRSVVNSLQEDPSNMDRNARNADVDYLLTGTIRTTKNRIRVSAEISSSKDGLVVWSESFDRKPGDYIGLQEELALSIVRALDIVTEPDRLRDMLAVGTKSVAAYEAFLRALAYEDEQDRDGDPELVENAITELQRARSADPRFARAHWAYAQQIGGLETKIDSLPAGSGPEPEAAYEAAQTAIEMAIATTDDPVQKLLYRSALAEYQFDFLTAQEQLNRFLQNGDGNSEDWIRLARYAKINSDQKTAAKALEQAYRVAKRDKEPFSHALTQATLALKFDKLEERLDDLLRAYPDVAIYRYQAHRSYLWLGKVQVAKRLLPRIQSSALQPEHKLLADLRQACAEMKTKSAQRILMQIVNLHPKRSTQWLAYSIAGEHKRAKELLEPLDNERDHAILIEYMTYPFFEPRDFPALYDRMRGFSRSPRKAVPIPGGCVLASGAFPS